MKKNMRVKQLITAALLLPLLAMSFSVQAEDKDKERQRTTPVTVTNTTVNPVPISMVSNDPISIKVLNGATSFLVPFDMALVPVKVHLTKAAILEDFSFACASASGIHVRVGLGSTEEFSVAIDQEGSFALPSGVTIDPAPAVQGTSFGLPMTWLPDQLGIVVKSSTLTRTGMNLPVTSDVTLSLHEVDARGTVTNRNLAACTGYLVLRFMN
jgi:hypothetical protein